MILSATLALLIAAQDMKPPIKISDTASSQGTYQSPVQNPWRKTKATFYGMPYDDGKKRLCADGVTVYKSDGNFCATRLVPLGSIIEVRRGKVTLRLKVADTQAKRFGHLIDIPTGTWAKFGAKYSIGVLPVEWRVVK